MELFNSIIMYLIHPLIIWNWDYCLKTCAFEHLSALAYACKDFRICAASLYSPSPFHSYPIIILLLSKTLYSTFTANLVIHNHADEVYSTRKKSNLIRVFRNFCVCTQLLAKCWMFGKYCTMHLLKMMVSIIWGKSTTLPLKSIWILYSTPLTILPLPTIHNSIRITVHEYVNVKTEIVSHI